MSTNGESSRDKECMDSENKNCCEQSVVYVVKETDNVEHDKVKPPHAQIRTKRGVPSLGLLTFVFSLYTTITSQLKLYCQGKSDNYKVTLPECKPWITHESTIQCAYFLRSMREPGHAGPDLTWHPISDMH